MTGRTALASSSHSPADTHAQRPVLSRPDRLPVVWWLSPLGLALLLLVPTLLCAALLGDDFYNGTARTARHLTVETVLLLAAGAFTFVVAAVVGSRRDPLRTRTKLVELPLDPAPRTVLEKSASVLFALTCLGYAFLVAGAASRGLSLGGFLQIATSGDYSGGQLRRYFASFGVLSVFTQLGVAYATVVGLLVVSGHRSGRLVARLGLVVLLAAARSLLLNERLALLEVVIPLGTLLLSGYLLRRPVVPMVVRLAPALILPAFVFAFALFEATRSYAVQGRGVSVTAFGADRLLSYYVTAYNNGQLLLWDAESRPRIPYRTVEAFWASPVVADSGLFRRLAGYDAGAQFGYLLQTQANPEYNSPGGLVLPFVDFGMLGGLVYLAVAGYVCGRLFRGYREGCLSCSLIYPLLVVALAEMPRYLYWSQARFWVPVIALLVVSSLLSAARNEKERL